MKLEDCLKCKHFAEEGRGYVICNFWELRDQRVTHVSENGEVMIVICPLEK
jgi:hypothetical protein